MIETTKPLLVEIQTGKLIEAAALDGGRFWTANEVRQDGTPDRRFHGHPARITRHGSGEHVFFGGRHAAFDASREVAAIELRAEVARLKALYDAAERALWELYCEPAN